MPTRRIGGDAKADYADAHKALEDANRRLRDDGSFYCDVRDRFGSAPCTGNE